MKEAGDFCMLLALLPDYRAGNTSPEWHGVAVLLGRHIPAGFAMME